MNIFKIALPGFGIKDKRPENESIDSQYASPKVDTTATPAHAGVINVNWQSSITVPYGTSKLLYTFKHGYNYIPSVVSTFRWTNGSRIINGIPPFNYGALGVVIMEADATNINLKYFSFDASIPLTTIPPFIISFRYYVFAERGHE